MTPRPASKQYDSGDMSNALLGVKMDDGFKAINARLDSMIELQKAKDEAHKSEHNWLWRVALLGVGLGVTAWVYMSVHIGSVISLVPIK